MVVGGTLMYNAPAIMDYGLAATCYPRDEAIGDAALVDHEELKKRLQGKKFVLFLFLFFCFCFRFLFLFSFSFFFLLLFFFSFSSFFLHLF